MDRSCVFSILAVFLACAISRSGISANQDGSADGISAFIVGGNRALDEQYPWQLSFQVRVPEGWGHACGAVLISERWAVTASHCLYDRRKPRRDGSYPRATSARVMAGSSTLFPRDPDATIHNIVAVTTPAGFSTVYDVALLKLQTPANISRSDIAPILIANESEPNTTGNCMISGWGFDAYNAKKGINHLREAPVNLLTWRDCNATKWPVYPTQLCAEGQRKGSSACYGDSGGPLVCYRDDETPVLVGLGSYVYTRCQTTRPNVLANIAYFRNWLRQLTGIDDL